MEATKLDSGKRKISLIHPSLLEAIIKDSEEPALRTVKEAIVHLATAAHAESAVQFYVSVIEAATTLTKITEYNPVAQVAIAMEYGEQKPEYGRNNWKKGMAWSRLIDAAQRHLLAILDGEIVDKDSGNLHISHAYGSIHMLLGNYVMNVGTNDIY